MSANGSLGRKRPWLWALTLVILALLVWMLGRGVARRPARPELGVTQGASEPVRAAERPRGDRHRPKGKTSGASDAGAPAGDSTAVVPSRQARP